MVFSRPPALPSFEGGWNRVATHGVYHTVLYSSHCLRLTVITSDSELRVRQWFTTTGGLGRPRLRVLRAPASRLGGGRTLGYWHHGRKREAAAGARCRGSRTVPVEPLPNIAEKNSNTTFRRIYNERKSIPGGQGVWCLVLRATRWLMY